jgi:hypothetical protein
LIAGVGSLVMITMLLTFVLIPRRADRQLAQAIAALPPARDTLVLREALRTAQRNADSALARVAAAEAAAQSARVLLMAPDSAVGASASPSAAASADSVGVTALRRELARVRQAPLVESYRTLATTPALRADARVRAALDSIEQLNREREASAALGGPDARYAALTGRLTALGQRLERLAADELARRATSGPDSVSGPTFVDAPVDSLLASAAAASVTQRDQQDSALQRARRENEALTQQRAALRARTQVSIPPVAMLLASLVLGLSVGFAVALYREMRRPTVSDADELEALTHSRVIVHTATRDAWALLHLSLTNMDDVVHDAQVLADRPLLAGTVGLNLAATAARESRATVVVDLATKSDAILPLLPRTVLRGQPPADSAWDTARAMTVGRDATVALVLPRRHRERTAVQPHVSGFDLALFITDTPLAPALPPQVGAILCARRGVTSLKWVVQAVEQLRTDGRSVHAALLWSGELPLVGGVTAD